VVGPIVVAARGSFVGGFATHPIALPSILGAASWLLRPAFTPPPVCCGATNPLPRRQPLVEDYAHDFPYPHPPPSAPRASATFLRVHALSLFTPWIHGPTRRSRWALRFSPRGEHPRRWPSNLPRDPRRAPGCLGIHRNHRSTSRWPRDDPRVNVDRPEPVHRANWNRRDCQREHRRLYAELRRSTPIYIGINIVVPPAINRHHLHHRRSRGLLNGDAVR